MFCDGNVDRNVGWRWKIETYERAKSFCLFKLDMSKSKSIIMPLHSFIKHVVHPGFDATWLGQFQQEVLTFLHYTIVSGRCKHLSSI